VRFVFGILSPLTGWFERKGIAYTTNLSKNIREFRSAKLRMEVFVDDLNFAGCAEDCQHLESTRMIKMWGWQ